MSDMNFISDEDLINSLIGIQLPLSEEELTEQESETIQALSNECMKRICISHLSLGLIVAIDKGLDMFSEFTDEGFRSDKELLHNIKASIRENVKGIMYLKESDKNVEEYLKEIGTKYIDSDGKSYDENPDE